MNTRAAIRSWLAAPALVACLLLAGTATADMDGKAVYEKDCASCHGPDGKGQTPAGKALKVMDLIDKKWAAADSLPTITAAIKDGIPRMPAMGSKLSVAEIDAVAHYVQTIAGAGAP